MIVSAFFTENGLPKTGLSATLRIRDLSDDSLVVTDAAMSEVGDGFYKYDFSSYDSSKEYAIRCDGSATLADHERYTYGGNDTQTSLPSSDISSIASSVWAATDAGSVSYEDAMLIMRRMIENKVLKSGDIITIYEEDESTPWRQYNLGGGGRVEV